MNMSQRIFNFFVPNLEAAFKRPSMSLAEVQSLLRLRAKSIKRGVAENKDLMCSEAAETFNNKPEDYARLVINKTKLPKKDGKEDKLDLPDTSITKIGKVIGPSTETLDEIKKFKDTILALNKRGLSFDAKKGPILKARNDTVTNIKKLHALEKKKLQDLFDNDTTFQQTFKDPTADDVKPLMIAALEKSQEKQLSDFQEKVLPDIEKTHEVRVQTEACAVITHLLQQSGEKAFIAQILAERGKAQSGVANIDYDTTEPNDIVLSPEELKKLTSFLSKSGKKIEFNHDSNTISFKSSNLGFGATAGDMFTLALLAKASGWDTINFKIEHSSPDKAQRWAKDAYNAAIEAGFPPEKITIRIKDEKGQYVVKSVAELFGAGGTDAKPKIGLDKETEQPPVAYEDAKRKITNDRAEHDTSVLGTSNATVVQGGPKAGP